MGKLVVFWSPYIGVAKVTASLCVIVGSFGVHYPETDVAICSALSNFYGPEEYLIDQSNTEFIKNIYKKTGIDVLKLHFRQAMLSSEIIRNSAVSLKMKSLFLYPNSTCAEKEVDDITFQLMTETLKEEYELVFLDLGSGEQDQKVHFLEHADLIITVLPEARRYRTHFLENYETLLTKKRCCILIGGYLGKLFLAHKNYFSEKRQDKKCETIGMIPLNMDYFKALEWGKTLDFFYRNQCPGKKEDNYEFIVQTKNAMEGIRKKIFL